MSVRATGALLCAAVLVLATSAVAEPKQKGRVTLDPDRNESRVKTNTQAKPERGVRRAPAPGKSKSRETIGFAPLKPAEF